LYVQCKEEVENSFLLNHFINIWGLIHTYGSVIRLRYIKLWPSWISAW